MMEPIRGSAGNSDSSVSEKTTPGKPSLNAYPRGAELTTERENLHHAAIATTSIYAQSDEVRRARQMNQAFAAR